VDFYPLVPQTATPSLSDGVMVLYERNDIVGILDFLLFLNFYKTHHDKEINELPAIFINGENADSEKLFARLSEVFPDGEGIMNTEIVTQIMNSDRDFFEEYMDHLEDLVLTDDKEPEEDTDHPLYEIYDMFLSIEFEFFPSIEEMN